MYRRNNQLLVKPSSSSSSVKPKFINATLPAEDPFDYRIYDDEVNTKNNLAFFPRTSVFIVFSCLMTIMVYVALYGLVMASHENNLVVAIDNAITRLEITDLVIRNNITDLTTRLNEADAQLIILEAEIDILQQNVTYLQQRIDKLECNGIISIDGVSGIALEIISGNLDDLEVITNSSNLEVIVNTSKFQVILNDQKTQLQTLNTFVDDVKFQFELLNSETLRSINFSPAVMNNIDFVGVCNASITPNPMSNDVFVDACMIQQQIENEFQKIFANFQESLQKIAILNANITFINEQVTIIENIISNITNNGLFTVNNRLPDVSKSISIVGEFPFINVTDGFASNEIVVTNNAVRTINNVSPLNDSGDFKIVAGNGIGITNIAPDTIQIDNTISPKKCSIFQTAFNVITAGLPGQPIIGEPFQNYMDVGFVNANTVAVPAGCAPVSGIFTRFGVATPFISIINQVCIPNGKWILQFNADLSTFPQVATIRDYMALNIGLGSEGPVRSTLPLIGMDLNVVDS